MTRAEETDALWSTLGAYELWTGHLFDAKGCVSGVGP